MATYLEKGRGFRYDFQLYGQRYRSPRGFPTRRECEDAEAVLRRRLRRQKAGLETDEGRAPAPSFDEWAGVYRAYVQERADLGLIKRPDIIEGNLNVVLRFFGRAPAVPEDLDYACPYHDLRLDDPIHEPEWLRRFEEWMTQRRVSKSTRNHYLNTLSALYRLALHPEYHYAAPTITANPFLARPRARWKRRTATVTPAQLVTWIEHASYHARLAMSIAALAPKLRLANILALEWRKHVDLRRGVIVVDAHKTDANGRPLVAPISKQLRAILQDAHDRAPHSTHVVRYRGVPVKTIDGAVRAAAEAAGLTWGRKVAGGVTFHSLRHSMATLLGQLGVHPLLHQGLMGQDDYETTRGYTHLDTDDQRPAAEQLSRAVRIKSAVVGGATRVHRDTETRRPGGIRRAGGTPGEVDRPPRRKQGVKRSQRGLRRGSFQKPAKRR